MFRKFWNWYVGLGNGGFANITHAGTLPDSAAKTDFYALFDNGTVTGIVDADCAAGMALSDAKLATITTAGKVNTGALTTTSAAQGDVLYHNGTIWTRLGAGTAGQVLATGGAAANPAWSTKGKIVQIVNVMDGVKATGSTVIPWDNVAPPQNTEGTQFMTLAITPTSATNYLLIQVIAQAESGGGGRVIIALFQDTTANALAAQFTQSIATGGQLLMLNHYMTSGTTSATTFKIRIGSDQAGTVTYNGASNTAYMGGVQASSMTITEISAT